MTAHGELYVDEVCRDEFKNELDLKFGKNKWKLDGCDFGDYWEMNNFPTIIEVDVLNYETDEKIGRVKIYSEPYIEDDGFNRWVDVKPIKIEFV